MKFFLDTANVDDIRRAADLGLADGVTTNPSLVSREKREFEPLIQEICGIVSGPVSAEVTTEELEEMISQARHLSSLAPNVVVKIPVGETGLHAVRLLESEGIKTNVTLVFSALQALLVARAGASYISPFIGRLDDIGHTGMDLVEDILDILHVYSLESEVIVASIRHPLHVLQAARLGAHISTIPPSVLFKLLKHPLTDVGLRNFMNDWKKLEESIK